MSFRLVMVTAGAVLLSVPAFAQTNQRDDRINTVRQLAGRVGQVLGAASACKEISQGRIKSITDKITGVIQASVTSRDEIVSIVEMFETNAAEGRRATTSGQTGCDVADRDLANLEKVASLSQPLPLGSAAAPSPGTPASVNPSAAIPSLPLSPSQSGPGVVTPSAVTPSAVALARGITEKEIRFGMSAPFTGPAKELGLKMKLGIETAFKVTNEAGGVNGRQIRLVPADDGYEPTRTAETMKVLYDKEQVFGIIGNVGTPTTMVALPYALERKMLFFGAFTGAGLLRRDPPDRYVFNYRASYAEETEAVVKYLVKVRRIKPDQIAVFAQQDGFGDSGFAGVAKVMRALRGGDGGNIVRLGYKRNTVDVEEAVNALKSPALKNIRAVVMVGTYRPCAKFIEKTRDLFPNMIYTNVSFVGSTSLAEELMLLGPKYATGVIVTQVVPGVDGYSSLVLEYKNAIAKYFPGEAPDYVSLEGYIAATVLIEGLKRAGPQPDTEKVVEALESMRDYDIGLGTPIKFGRTNHQAVTKVWGTEIDASGRYQAIELD